MRQTFGTYIGTKRICRERKKAKKFADAHEQVDDNPIKYMEMDLYNNELGRRIAIEYAGQGYDVFSQKILEAIKNKEVKVLKWDQNVN